MSNDIPKGIGYGIIATAIAITKVRPISPIFDEPKKKKPFEEELRKAYEAGYLEGASLGTSSNAIGFNAFYQKIMKGE